MSERGREGGSEGGREGAPQPRLVMGPQMRPDADGAIMAEAREVQLQRQNSSVNARGGRGAEPAPGKCHNSNLA